MLLSFHERDRRFVPFDDPAGTNGRGWYHAASPSEEEQRVLEGLGVPSALLSHALDADEIARIATVGGTELVVLRVPIELRRDTERYAVVPLGVALLEDRVVTISLAPFEAIEDLLADTEMDPRNPIRGILEVLLRATHRYLEVLRRIEREMERLEDGLAASLKNSELLELLARQKTLTKLETSLRSNQVLLRRLRRDARCKVSGEDKVLLADVLVELQQAIEMTTIRTSELAGMMDAFASLVSNNLNVVMKFMTSLALVLTVPTIVASLYGMNVPLPLQSDPRAFAVIVGASAIVCLALVLVFRKRRWL